VACGMIFWNLSSCLLSALYSRNIDEAYRDRRFYATGSYLRPVYLQVIPMFVLHSRICPYLSIVSFSRWNTGHGSRKLRILDGCFDKLGWI
jgi:hypothetical protein